MRLSIASEVVIVLDHIANLLHHVRSTILYRVIELQLNELSFTIEKDRGNIFLASFDTKTFSTLLLR